MFSSIGSRLRPTPSGVIAVLALVLAMTGGAYAAKKYVITSTAQIKPSVLKSLQGKAGPAGANGTNGANGGAGAKGDSGAKGADGSAGTSATTVAIPKSSATCNKQGGVEVHSASPTVNLCNGQTGFTDTLPSEKTETGTWAAGLGLENQFLVFAPISFTIPLSGPLDAAHVHLINEAGEEVLNDGTKQPSTTCLGSADEPTAVKGNLCVYTGFESDIQLWNNYIQTPRRSGAGAGSAGAILEVEIKAEFGAASGTWAVTAL